jgi:hypothetical protein
MAIQTDMMERAAYRQIAMVPRLRQRLRTEEEHIEISAELVFERLATLAVSVK